MSSSRKPVVIGLHFAKTGGTSINSHATTNMGADECFSLGDYVNARRLFAGQPLLPELSPEQKARIRFVFGHGVYSQTLHHFSDRDLTLFVVCRDPYRRFLSSYKHVVRQQQKFGRTDNARTVFNDQPINPFSTTILKQFGGLAPAEIRDSKERLVAILQCFRFVLSTEHLNQQSQPLFASLGLPPMTISKRVYPETVDLGDLSEEEIRERDDLDSFVNEAINEKFAEQPDIGELQSLNPFGFDQSALRIRQQALAAAAPTKRRDSKKAYSKLYRFLDGNGRLEAAKILIDAGELSKQAGRFFEMYCKKVGRTFEDADMPSRNLCYQGNAYLRLNMKDKAANCARRAIEANPENPMAFYLAGRVDLKSGNFKQSVASLERAVELNPNHIASFNTLAKAYMCRGRLLAAYKAHQAAKRI